ncbi:MAG: hypothetical protein ACI4JW_00105 [Oscillospiraceae bacterium]
MLLGLNSKLSLDALFDFPNGMLFDEKKDDEFEDWDDDFEDWDDENEEECEGFSDDDFEDWGNEDEEEYEGFSDDDFEDWGDEDEEECEGFSDDDFEDWGDEDEEDDWLDRALNEFVEEVTSDGGDDCEEFDDCDCDDCDDFDSFDEENNSLEDIFGCETAMNEAYSELSTGRFSYPFGCVCAMSAINDLMKSELRPELVLYTIFCIGKLEADFGNYRRDDVYACVLRGLNNELLADYSFHEVCHTTVNATIDFLERLDLLKEQKGGNIVLYKGIDVGFLNYPE